MAGTIEAIYTAPAEGAAPEKVTHILAVQGCGLQGDRYCEGTGHWSRFGRVCEVTFIAAEDLEAIERETGVQVKNGEHRRNVVTRGIDPRMLRNRRFRVGEALFEYRGPRSVCRYIERIAEPGMTAALRGRGGFCARVVVGGAFNAGDVITLVENAQ
jgi:MOSC domain-containing protein YiiM